MRSTAHLPSLAGLRLGAAPTGTGMEMRAARQRRVEGASALSPPPLRLTGLPRDVIDVVVTQAALDARNAEEPAQAICEWMGQFCKAAKVQGVAGCEDRWYMLALQTFGVPPAEKKPSYVHGTWRELFAQVCSMDTSIGEYEDDGYWLDDPEVVALKWDTPRMKVTAAFGKLRANFASKRSYEELNGIDPWEDGSMYMSMSEAMHQRVKQDWDLWMRGEEPVHYKETRFYTVAALLLLKGAYIEPFESANATDQEMYDAMNQFVAGTISKAEALHRVRDALDRGARLDVAGMVNGEYLDIMSTALATGDGDIINLLFRRGWALNGAELHGFALARVLLARTVPNVRALTLRMAFADLPPLLIPDVSARGFAKAFNDWLPWLVDEATTRRLIDAMRPFVVYEREGMRANPLGYTLTKVYALMQQVCGSNCDDDDVRYNARTPYKAQWLALLLEPGQTLADHRAQVAQARAQYEAVVQYEAENP